MSAITNPHRKLNLLAEAVRGALSGAGLEGHARAVQLLDEDRFTVDLALSHELPAQQFRAVAHSFRAAIAAGGMAGDITAQARTVGGGEAHGLRLFGDYSPATLQESRYRQYRRCDRQALTTQLANVLAAAGGRQRWAELDQAWRLALAERWQHTLQRLGFTPGAGYPPPPPCRWVETGSPGLFNALDFGDANVLPSRLLAMTSAVSAAMAELGLPITHALLPVPLAPDAVCLADELADAWSACGLACRRGGTPESDANDEILCRLMSTDAIGRELEVSRIRHRRSADPPGSVLIHAESCARFGVATSLLETYGLDMPLAVSPVQVAIVPLASETVEEYAETVRSALTAAGFRAMVFANTDSMQRRLRHAYLVGATIWVVVGEAEENQRKVAVRSRWDANIQQIEFGQLPDKLAGMAGNPAKIGL